MFRICSVTRFSGKSCSVSELCVLFWYTKSLTCRIFSDATSHEEILSLQKQSMQKLYLGAIHYMYMQKLYLGARPNPIVSCRLFLYHTSTPR
jgi:hypothetical protein